MNTPIINPQTLNKEQRDMLQIYYWEADTDLNNDKELVQLIGYGRITLLKALFGANFFKKGE